MILNIAALQKVPAKEMINNIANTAEYATFNAVKLYNQKH